MIQLPEPKKQGSVSVEECISKRRSIRQYQNREFTFEQISQLLYSAQGITEEKTKFRASPSAGALYPMELYLVSSKGVFHYVSNGHKLKQIMPKDIRAKLAVACRGQDFVREASINIVIAAIYERAASRYGNRGIRYTDMEAGHIAQNIHLQAIALGLGSVPVGAFNDKEVKKLLNLPPDQQPIYIIPVGYPQK